MRALYDWTAEGYEGLKEFDRADEIAFLAVPLLHRLEEAFDASAPVLDVATGTGRLPAALLDIPDFTGHVTALDISPRMLAIAEQKLRGQVDAGRLTLMEHPAVPLPFESNRFGAVTCLEALEFLPDRMDALLEMVRVLRPGGWLLVTNRIGWEARLMPGKVDSRKGFEARLAGLGLAEIQTKPWQTYYDLIFARAPLS